MSRALCPAARHPSRTVATPMFPLSVIVIAVIALALIFWLAAAGVLPDSVADPGYTT